MILKIHITLLLALLYNLYISKKSIFFIAYLFIIMHELSHMIVALLLNVDIQEITLLPFGATARYIGKINPLKEFLIAIAGPFATLIFAFFYHHDTYFKVNILILLFNLIPIYPLDGGRILKVILIFIFKNKWGNRIHEYCNKLILFLFIIFAIYLLIKYKNISFLVISLYVLKISREEMKKDKALKRINYLQIDK